MRLLAICVVELAIAVALAVTLSASPAAPGGESNDDPPTSSSARSVGDAGAVGTNAHAAAARSAVDEIRPSAPADLQPAADAPRRKAVSAKVPPEDPVGVLLTGTVRWRDGGMVAEPRVWASCGKLNRGANTGKDGSFALARLQPGEWQVKVAAEGAADLESTVTITDDAVQQRDFALARSFAVRVLIVTPDGQDATRAARMALRTSGDFHVAGQKARFPDRLAPTEYSIVFVGDAKWDREMNPENGFAGTLSFVEPLPGHVALLLRNLVIEQQVVQPGQNEVRFVVDVEALKARLGSATVRIVDDATGAPLAGLVVAFATSSTMGGGQKTDADGRAVADNLAPGLFQFTVRSKDREVPYQVVRIEPGQQLDLGEVRLGAALPLKGRVVTADGKPATASLSWTELKWRTSPTEFAHNRSARIEADGSFELWGTGAGPIAVTARSRDDGVAAVVIDNPPAVPFELRLQPAAECVVTRPKDPTRAFVLTLYDSRHRAVAGVAIEPRLLEHRMTMPPGDYAFDVHDVMGQLLQSGALHFGATPARLEIR